MKRRDPLLRTAWRIARLLRSSDGHSRDMLSAEIAPLLEGFHMLAQLQRLHTTAAHQGWVCAAKRVWEDVVREIRITQRTAAAILSRHDHTRSPPPTLRCLVEDLRQLTEEFEHVEFDLKDRRIVAMTGPIELEEIALGPFAIELHLDRFTSRRDASCFDCVALKPNPARSNASVTHPHVQDRQLCCGDAALPIATALRQGRVSDAFCLIRSVLQTYNAASPYVPLDEWDSIPCADCGHTAPRDQTSCCEHCDRDCCDECMSICDGCDGSCCRGCLERDEEAETDLCPSCRTSCTACNRVLAQHHVERDTGLCPQCQRDQDVQDPEHDPEEHEPKLEDLHEAETQYIPEAARPRVP